MKEHNWKTEEADGGPVGWYDFTYCTICDAHCGSPGFKLDPFYPGTGIKLGDDCDTALAMVNEHKKKCKEDADKKVAYWNATKTPWPKVSLREFLGLREDEYNKYLETGEPPYHYSSGWYNIDFGNLMACNNQCPSCCGHED